MNVISYSLNTGQFSRYSDFKIYHSSLITGVTSSDNVAIFTDWKGNVKTFPGSEKVDTGKLLSSEIVLFGKAIRRIALYYNGGSPKVTVICKNRRFNEDVRVQVDVNQSGRFYGLKRGLKCDSVQFEISGAHTVEALRYTIA